jgi:hypothetical protein
VKSEFKIIKLKDSVLKDYISKTAKESSAAHKNISSTDKKELGFIHSSSREKQVSQTARGKASPMMNVSEQWKNDHFLMSSLMN